MDFRTMRGASFLSYKISRFLSPRHSNAVKSTSRTLASSSDKIVLEKDETGIATMYLNYAPLNMFDAGMLKTGVEVIRSAENDPDVKGIIVTSKFDGIFSAGLSIHDMYQKPHSHVAEYWNCVQDWRLSLYGCKKPTVACINGHAPAGGCGTALMCDYRVMLGGAKKVIGLNEVVLGIAPPFLIVDLMVRVVGQMATERACLTGKLFSAEEAISIGLVDEIGDLKDLQTMAKKALLKSMSINPEAYRLTKMVMREDHLSRLRRTKSEEAKAFAESILKPETQDAIGRYLASLARPKER